MNSIEPGTSDTVDPPILTPKLSTRWALRAVHIPLVVLSAVLFMVIDYLPLRGSDLWAHVSYGEWILDHRELPTEDPLLSLAEGMPADNTAWLSQLILAQVEATGGPEWLSHVAALTALVVILLLARIFYLQSQQPTVTLLGLLAFLLISWSRFSTIRPESYGLLCLVCLLRLIVGTGCSPSSIRDDHDRLDRLGSWRQWIGTALLFALWANLHGSFVCGLIVLGSVWLARVIEVAWSTRSLRAVAADRAVRRWFYLWEVGLAATLVNPQGIDLLLESLWFSVGKDNLRDMIDWQPLIIVSRDGIGFAITWTVMLLVMRHSRRRIPVAHALLLGGFAIAALLEARWLSWYAVVFGVVLVPHLADLMRRFKKPADRLLREPSVMDPTVMPVGRFWFCTLVCLLMVWIAFAFSPISSQLLGGKPRTPRQLFGDTTPLALTEFLRENRPEGQLFNPHWWGDWLVWDGPHGLKPFVTSQCQLVPRQVWQDYRRIAFAQAGWQEALDRYVVDMLIVDKRRQPTLSRLARTSADWTVQYQDEQAIVFRRQRR